jgi:hypothetical protein
MDLAKDGLNAGNETPPAYTRSAIPITLIIYT